MSEFEKQDDEVISLVTCGKRLPGKTCVFVPESEYCRFMELHMQNLELKQRNTNLRVLCSALSCLLAAFAILALV